MRIKEWRNNISESTLKKGKALFSGSFSKEEEIENLSSEIKEFTPATKNTLTTLIKNSKLKKGIKLPSRGELCAQITSFSYLDPEKRPYQIWDFYLEPLYNSLFHCIYLNHRQKICIIGYRGTDAKEKADLLSDIQLILWVNAIDPRVGWSLKLFDQVRKTHPEYEKRICGHSLGGTLCYIVAKHRKVDYCCTFNPWSAPNKIFILMLRDTLLKKEWTQNINTYKILWDPVSLFSYVWETTSFFLPKINPLKLHAMKNFL